VVSGEVLVVVVCVERGANDLHIVQLMPLPPHHLFWSSKISNGLPFWCRLTQIVLEKRLSNGCSNNSCPVMASWTVNAVVRLFVDVWPLNLLRVGLDGCKIEPAPFPVRMSYEVTKPGCSFLCLFCVAVFLCSR